MVHLFDMFRLLMRYLGNFWCGQFEYESCQFFLLTLYNVYKKTEPFQIQISYNVS